jgi:hypothetical protein
VDLARELRFLMATDNFYDYEVKLNYMENSYKDIRLWGNQLVVDFWLDIQQFIPTHVGKSQHCQGCCPYIPVHPHACGEINN